MHLEPRYILRMILTQFALAAGMDPKWVQNTASMLGRKLAYTREEARHFGLVKRIHEAFGIPLAAADDLATRCLSTSEPAHTAREFRSADGIVTITIDIARYLSEFSVALARARSMYEPRRRGRPAQPDSVSASQRASDHGIDLSLLDASLRLSPAERIRRLDANMDFARKLRRAPQ